MVGLLNRLNVQEIVRRALQEDLGPGDLTTANLPLPTGRHVALLAARKAGVVAGLPVAEEVWRCLDPAVTVTPLVPEGARVEAGQALGRVEGELSALLQGERVALNFLQHLSGIATRTALYVEAVQGYRARIADTRKTTPGLRELEKYAVRQGGGVNHRLGLFDAVLLKDNHLQAMGGIKEAVAVLRERIPFPAAIEVEVENLAQLEEALECGVRLILLDNMPVEEMRRAVEMAGGRALLEASGGINLATVREVAATGVDIISVGELTHSAPALDIGLDLC